MMNGDGGEGRGRRLQGRGESWKSKGGKQKKKIKEEASGEEGEGSALQRRLNLTDQSQIKNSSIDCLSARHFRVLTSL